MLNKPSLNDFKRVSAEKALITMNTQLWTPYQHFTIVFKSNNFNTIIYTKYYCVPTFIPNKQSFKVLKQVSAKNVLRTLKTQLPT